MPRDERGLKLTDASSALDLHALWGYAAMHGAMLAVLLHNAVVLHISCGPTQLLLSYIMLWSYI